MKLSKRLEAVANLVPSGATVYDIGCDHAYLSIYLTMYNNNKVIATDVKESACQIARKNIANANLEDRIDVIKTNGLNNLKIKSKDTIVIAGMGADTIIHILSDHQLPECLVILSHNHIEKIREFINKLGYYIDDERFLIDSKKAYVIIRFVKGKNEYSDEELLIGPILKNNKDYLNYQISYYDRIVKSIKTKVYQDKYMRIKDIYNKYL